MPERLPGAVVELPAPGTSDAAAFRLPPADFEHVESLTKNWLVGGRGQTANQVLGELEEVTGTPLEQGDRRGFYVDVGMGTYEFILTSKVGPEDAVWGTDDAAGLSKTSATGQHPADKRDVLQHVVAEGRTGSKTPGTLHIGHYHDGTYTESGTAGLYESPRDIVVHETNWDDSPEEGSTLELTITCELVAKLSVPIDAVQQATR